MKNGKIRFCYEIGEAPCRACDIGDTIDYFLDEDISPTIDAISVPVVPERENSGSGMTWWNICGACKTAINPNDKYCHECGRAILWTGNGEKNNA